MKTVLNSRTLIWIIGVIQPATADEIHAFWESIFPLDARSSLSALRRQIAEEIASGRAMCVSHDPPLYSLTYAGHLYLAPGMRAKRDKLRIYLLSAAIKRTFPQSREHRSQGSAGDSPATDTSTRIKGTAANMLLGLRSSGQPAYWPRFAERLFQKTGPSAGSRDINLQFLSFASEKQVRQACELGDADPIYWVLACALASRQN